ncbi:hypothetical protein RJ639_028422 [Escallonia herrerae]|uniref:Integrase catalytic domain-containing protein n=1 Tax=Escallonia herrerae TaxID=1293975 RepID=A0AA89BKP9_9ASTE|nr:hypothetical protein RJ639_028422 [Escallonia herrerae]
MVIVDRFSKYATFVASSADCIAEEAARLFFRHVVKYWGIPKFIVSDRDPRFTRKFWTELFKLLGSELHFSTSFHPQTDGQTERANTLLECYLQHFVSANQKDRARLLDVAYFSYNLMRSEATNQSLFEITIGQQPLTPLALVGDCMGKSPLAAQVARSWNKQVDVARSYLDKATHKIKKWADKRRRRPKEYDLRYMVMVKLLSQQFKTLRKVHKGLIQSYEGPFVTMVKETRRLHEGEITLKLCSDGLVSIVAGYIGHRRLLDKNHPWRRSKEFNGKLEKRKRTREYSGDDVLEQLVQVSHHRPSIQAIRRESV